MSNPHPATTGQTEAIAPPPPEHQLSVGIEDLSPHLPPPPAGAPRGPAPPQLTHFVRLHSYLIIFSILGTLSRIGLVSISTYAATPLPPLFWPQFVGSLIMGFFLEDKTLFPASTKTTTPLYLGLTTGYCGSVTTFSSFILGAFEQLAITAPIHPGRRIGDNIAAMLAYVIGTIAISLGGLQVGAHLAVFSKGFLRELRFRWTDTLAVPIGFGLWVASVIMAVFIKKWRGDVLFACVFSPPGAIVRFWASRLGNNPMCKAFPLGTFTVNMLGTAVLAGLLAGRYAHFEGNTCDVLRGLGDGFCGCLTTVSTFVAEVRGLRISHAYVYAGASIVVGLCLTILILGSYADMGSWDRKTPMLEIKRAVDCKYSAVWLLLYTKLHPLVLAVFCRIEIRQIEVPHKTTPSQICRPVISAWQMSV
ncbi:CrcB-like protein-domain-containing protein [Tuber brumale]|nr:CrcB-like protein-domain-containing protein [Tuber brumale]